MESLHISSAAWQIVPEGITTINLEAVDNLDSVLVSVLPGLAMPLGPVDLILSNDVDVIEERELRVDELTEILLSSNEDLVLHSTHELTVLAFTGEAGATVMLPDDHQPVDDKGHCEWAACS